MFFLCPVTDISATVAPIGVKFCMMCTYRSRTDLSPFRRVAPRSPNGFNAGRYAMMMSFSLSVRSSVCTSSVQLEDGEYVEKLNTGPSNDLE